MLAGERERRPTQRARDKYRSQHQYVVTARDEVGDRLDPLDPLEQAARAAAPRTLMASSRTPVPGRDLVMSRSLACGSGRRRCGVRCRSGIDRDDQFGIGEQLSGQAVCRDPSLRHHAAAVGQPQRRLDVCSRSAHDDITALCVIRSHSALCRGPKVTRACHLGAVGKVLIRLGVVLFPSQGLPVRGRSSRQGCSPDT